MPAVNRFQNNLDAAPLVDDYVPPFIEVGQQIWFYEEAVEANPIRGVCTWVQWMPGENGGDRTQGKLINCEIWQVGRPVLKKSNVRHIRDKMCQDKRKCTHGAWDFAPVDPDLRKLQERVEVLESLVLSKNSEAEKAPEPVEPPAPKKDKSEAARRAAEEIEAAKRRAAAQQ